MNKSSCIMFHTLSLFMVVLSLSVRKIDSFITTTNNHLSSRLQFLSDSPSTLSVGNKNKLIDPEDFEQRLTEVESQVLHDVTPNAIQIEALALKLKNGDLDLFPRYQRAFVWKQDKSSRLVVTALCNRMVPAVTVQAVEGGALEMIDGKQRLSSLLAFYLAGDDPTLFRQLVKDKKLPNFSTLNGLDESYRLLNGLTYNQLNQKRQKAYKNFNIPVAKVPSKTTKQDIFSCYEDINSGGEDLTAHQIRRVVHGGLYIDMLEDIVKGSTFQRVRDPIKFEQHTYEECKEELDRELPLRAFAFARSYGKFKNPIKYFLNDEVDFINSLDKRRQEEELKEMKKRLYFMIETWSDVFANNQDTEGVFRAWVEKSKGKGDWHWKTAKKKGNSISFALWDAMYTVTTELQSKYPKKEMYTKCKDKLVKAIKTMFQENPSLFAGSVTSKKFAERKHKLLTVLGDVLAEANPPQGSRCFKDPHGTLRRALYIKQNGLCSICSQTLDGRRILDGTYAHLDHERSYKKGGPTESENAGLVHSECNWKKGAG